jgi:hypothetical protein
MAPEKSLIPTTFQELVVPLLFAWMRPSDMLLEKLLIGMIHIYRSYQTMIR